MTVMRETVRRLADGTRTVRQIAEAAGCSYITAWAYCRRMKLPVKRGYAERRPRLDPAPATDRRQPRGSARDAVRRLADGTRTLRQIAEAAGCSYVTALKYCKAMGLPVKRGRPERRPPGSDHRAPGMRAMLAEGKTLHQVGEAYNLSRERVRQLVGGSALAVRGHRVPPQRAPRKTDDPDLAARVRQAVAEGLTRQQTAEAVGLRPSTVQALCKRHGISHAQPTAAEQWARVERLLLDGATMADAAQACGLSCITGYAYWRRFAPGVSYPRATPRSVRATAPHDAALRQAATEGLSMAEAARRLGVHPRVVGAYAARHGIAFEPARRSWSRKDDERLREMHAEGRTLNDAAIALGRSYHSVWTRARSLRLAFFHAPRRSARSNDDAVSALADGTRSARDIARAIGASEKDVRVICRRLNLPLKTRCAG